MVTRRGPVNDAMAGALSLREAMDRLFSESFIRPGVGPSGQPGMPIDVYEDGEKYLIYALMPGVDPDQINITLHDNQLVLEGELAPVAAEGVNPLHRELPSGPFRREITLPRPVDFDKVEAAASNGLLKLTVPKSEAAKPRQIKVKGA